MADAPFIQPDPSADPKVFEPTEVGLQVGPDQTQQEPEAPTQEQLFQQQLEESQRREQEANSRLDQERARFDRLLESAPTQQAPQTPGVDPYHVPDAMTEPAEFARHQQQLRAQDNQAMLREMDRRQAETRQESQVNELWHEFQVAYPDMAGMRDLAGLAFQHVTGGVMPTSTDGLLERVKDKMNSMTSGKITASTPTTNKNRTGGVTGGTTPSTTPKPVEAEPIDERSMGDHILDWQAEHGYI